MVKKIDNNRRTSVGQTPQVDGIKPAEVGKVDTVTRAREVSSAKSASGVKRVGRKITVQEKDELFAIVQQESDRLFAEGILPEGKKKVVEGAVKMAIDGGAVEEDDAN